MSENNLNNSGKEKINVAVLGASGVVGQVFVRTLSHHGWFNLAAVTGSDSKAGKLYSAETQWLLPFPLPETASKMRLENLDMDSLKKRGIRIIFSALPADVAKSIESSLRENGFYVFSNAGALRYEKNVPILIPEVNPDALGCIKNQGFPRKGFVVTNANCSTTGLAVALAPLKQFGIKEVFVSTYQSISGAGYPGLAGLDILDNTIPYIQGEEEKMMVELEKILELGAAVYPHCVRVPVLFGHLETLWLSFEKPVETDDIRGAWQAFECPYPGLPSLPFYPVVYSEEPRFPQSKMSFWGSPSGMQVFTGRLRKEKERVGFSLLVNNLVKGAAGGAIANAELFLHSYGHECGLKTGAPEVNHE
jgi:aspartate-semialdehyde dehydrogenase